MEDVEGLPFEATRVIDYYDVSGATAAEIRDQLDRHETEGGRDAHTGWKVRWRFSAPDCRTATWTTNLAVTYTFPRWQAPPDALGTTTARWNAYVSDLWCHAYGYAAIGLDAADAVDRALNAIGPQTSCDALQAAGEQAFSETVEEYRQLGERYGVETNYGPRFP